MLIDGRSISLKKYIKLNSFLILSFVFFISFQWSNLNLVVLSPSELSIDNLFIFNSEIRTFSYYLMSFIVMIYLIILVGSRLRYNGKRVLFLVLSISTNLGLLGFFKYYNFFIESLLSFFASFSYYPDLEILSIILPVGISFYTFQTLSYTIDIFKGQLKPVDSFWDFALFVSYFPQLVAGPIERAVLLLPRLQAPRIITSDHISRGGHLILLGIFKKVAIADGVGGYVNSIYSASSGVLAGDIIIATLCFALQVYCDFSGYTDIARGVSKLLGIDLMVNFRLPYFSKNLGEFWRRWHISLYSWFIDYIYNPILISTRSLGKLGAVIAISVTFTLSGIWHGAAWTYVLWGAMHAIGLIFLLLTNKRRKKVRKVVPKYIYDPLSLASTFTYVCLVYIFFRAPSLQQLITFLHEIFFNFTLTTNLPIELKDSALVGIPALVLYEIWEFKKNKVNFYLSLPAYVRGMICAIMFYCLMLGRENVPMEFIYFQF